MNMFLQVNQGIMAELVQVEYPLYKLLGNRNTADVRYFSNIAICAYTQNIWGIRFMSQYKIYLCFLHDLYLGGDFYTIF